MATQIGPKIGIDGEKEYRTALKQIIDETKSLDAAMNKTASTWTVNTSAMTKNRAQAQNLVQQIGLQEEKIRIMSKMLEESTAKYGESAAATRSWQRAVDNATASLNEMNNELRGFNGAENFSDLSTKFADVGTKMQNIGQKLTAVGTKMTAAITLPLVAAGGAAVNLASDMEEASSKVDVIFGSMSESVKSFADTSLEAYGVSNVKAMEMMGTFGAMATEMGISDRAAAEMATTLTGLSGDLAAFHNSEIEITQTALEGIFTGQTRALTAFAGAINQANLEEFAAKQGKVYNSMTEAEKVMARYQLVLERTKDAQGNFAMTGEGTAGSIQKFKGAVQELGVAFGEQLLPIITPIIQAITKLIQKLSSLPEPIQKIVVILLAITAAMGPVILIIGTFIGALGNITSAIPGVIAALIKLASAIVGVELAAAPAIGVILALVAAIAAAVALGYVIGANWDQISAAASNMANSVKSAFQKVNSYQATFRSAALNLAKALVDGIKEIPGKVVSALREAIEGIKAEFDRMIQTAKKSGKDFVEGFVDGIKQKISHIVKVVKEIAETIKEFLGFSCPDKGPLHEYETWMPDFMMGLAKGINQNKGLVTRAMQGLAKDMALPLSANASMNMALAGADGSSSMSVGGTTMNVYVDHINDLNDLIRIQNQAQQRYRMGVR